MRRFVTLVWIAAAAVLAAPVLRAHEMRPAYLEIREQTAGTYDVLWKVPARGVNERLALYVQFSDDTQTRTEPIAGFIGNAHVSRWQVQRQGGLAGSTVTINGLSSMLTDVLVRIEHANGASTTHRLTPDRSSFVVETAPSLGRVAWTYLVLGVEHILMGIDHLLFVLALLMLVEGRMRLVKTITAFTLAHSITLALATLGFVHVPGPPVEAIIALSIVFVAAEIVRGHQSTAGVTARRPWVVAFTFGLLHGFGFAGALSELGLPQQAIPLALLFFNVGVEVGQLLFVAAVLAVSVPVRRLRVRWPRGATLAPPYAIGGLAMFWVIQRAAAFWS